MSRIFRYIRRLETQYRGDVVVFVRALPPPAHPLRGQQNPRLGGRVGGGVGRCLRGAGHGLRSHPARPAQGE